MKILLLLTSLISTLAIEAHADIGFQWKVSVVDEQAKEEKSYRLNEPKKFVKIPTKQGKCEAWIGPAKTQNGATLSSLILTCNKVSVSYVCSSRRPFEQGLVAIDGKNNTRSSLEISCENGF